MQASNILSGLFVLLNVTASASDAQQQFTQTVSRQNTSCNSACSVLDIPELNNNPLAIIFVTPVANAKTPNPHPIGAYFMYLKKWSIYNLDGAAIPEGATFTVQYYPSPDSDRFIFVVPRQGRKACIDHAGLTDTPSAQVRVFPTGSPTRGALYNKDDIKTEYDATAHQWCIANINGNPVPSETAYNVAIASGRASASNALAAAPPPPPSAPSGVAARQGTLTMPPATLAPQPLAPLTVVVRTEWPLPDQGNIALSSGYCTPIWGAYADSSILATDFVIVTGQTANQGHQLKWTATVDNGAVQLNVCNSQKASLGASGALQLTGRTVNILVLR
jgi:hypothetical protein